jgi:hypothetical protein
MLCSRPGNILVNTSLVVRCFQLNDDNRICLEPFEACPGGDENAFAVAPRIEVLRETHGRVDLAEAWREGNTDYATVGVTDVKLLRGGSRSLLGASMSALGPLSP